MDEQTKTKVYALQAYGVIRIIVGVAQFVGLFSGYFLTEWILKYPSQIATQSLNKDVIALVYLAVIVRAAFHLWAGIGIARVKLWGRMFLLCLWPLVLLITMGLSVSLLQSWISDGFLTALGAGVVGYKLLAYLLFIAFDLFVVCPAIRDLNTVAAGDTEIPLSIEAKRIAVIIVASAMFFVVLCFGGRSINKGFHQGYYKLSAEKTKQLLAKYPDAPAVGMQAKEEASARAKATLPSAALDKKLPPAQEMESDLSGDDMPSRQSTSNAPKQEKERTNNIAYQTVLMALGAGCLVIACAMQLLISMQQEPHSARVVFSYSIAVAGFVLLAAYSASMKGYLLAGSYVVCSFLCAGTVFMYMRRL